MGANIGTTITGQLIALDVGALAPLIAFIGVAIVVFSKNEKSTVCRRNHCRTWYFICWNEHDGRFHDTTS